MENPFRSITGFNSTPKDKHGVELIYGDLLIERGRGSGPHHNGGRYESCLLWIYLGQKPTLGYYFCDGYPREIYHTHPINSEILEVNKLSDEVMNRFMNGAYSVHIIDGDKREIHEIINEVGIFKYTVAVMIDLTKVLPNSFYAGSYPHCDDVERGLCHIVVDGEKVLKEKFDLKHLEEYDKLFGFPDANIDTLNKMMCRIEDKIDFALWNMFENEQNSITGLA